MGAGAVCAPEPWAAERADEPVFVKHTYDCFLRDDFSFVLAFYRHKLCRNSSSEIPTLSFSGEMSEQLVKHLRNLGAERLYFAGALTKACVMFSANSAFTLGFEGRAAT